MPKPMSYREFEAFFDRIYDEKRAKRRQAVGTLEPGRMDRFLRSGQPLPPEFGTKPDGTPFTKKDLQKFQARRKRIEKRYGARSGVPVADIWAKTLKIDRIRAQREIRNATLFKIDTLRGGAALLKFKVTASPQSQYRHHQSQIRLEEWQSAMASGRNPRTAIQQAVGGRISLECDCGRFQYWYRYLIGAMGAGIKPLERAYPKIRNPRLKGAVCKHLVTALANLQSPAVQRLLAAEMRRQADAVGYGDEDNRFVDEGKTGRRTAASMRASRADVKKAYRRYQQSRLAVAKQRRKEKEKMEKEQIERMARETARKEKAKREQAKTDRDAMATELRGFVDGLKSAKFQPDAIKSAVGAWAAGKGMAPAAVEKLASDYKVSLG